MKQWIDKQIHAKYTPYVLAFLGFILLMNLMNRVPVMGFTRLGRTAFCTSICIISTLRFLWSSSAN